jgi:hypothetical protein
VTGPIRVRPIRPATRARWALLRAGVQLTLSDFAELARQLGLRAAPGERRPSTRQLYARRDALIRDGCALYLAGAENPAAEFSTRWRRWHAIVWPRERHYDQMPARHCNKLEGVFWQLSRLQPDRAMRVIQAGGALERALAWWNFPNFNLRIGHSKNLRCDISRIHRWRPRK